MSASTAGRAHFPATCSSPLADHHCERSVSPRGSQIPLEWLTMNPKQKRKVGSVLIWFFLISMVCEVGFGVFFWRTGLGVSPALFAIMIPCLMPLLIVGINLISQAKKEEGE
jgi:hypothetical protein